MIEKTFYFMGGLPRAGSTVLGAVLNQNPDIYVTPTSPLLNLLEYNEYGWQKNPSVIANRYQEQSYNITEAIINGCWEHIDRKIILDKCRGWVNYLPSVEFIFKTKPKMLMPVRDIPSILASYMRVLRKTEQPWYVDEELISRGLEINDENRVDAIWHLHVKDTLEQFNQVYKGRKDNFLLIEYDELVRKPDLIVERVYDFLELPKYKHYYFNIENIAKENDMDAWRIRDLHLVNPELKKTASHPSEILGKKVYEKYAMMNLEFWRYK